MIRALCGGTYDPFHSGHRALIHHLLAGGYAEAVHVVPARRSPHREAPVASARHRLAMARAAIASLDGAVVDARELERAEPSYTVETLEELVAEHPEDAWRLVIGSDQIDAFLRWRRPHRLLELAELLVVARDGWRGDLPADLADRAVAVTDFDHPARASEIRARIGRGEWPVALLPEAVARYIRDHGLYGVRGERVRPQGEAD
jgi:nicotinate-nucleotide adenylyltransferase